MIYHRSRYLARNSSSTRQFSGHRPVFFFYFGSKVYAFGSLEPKVRRRISLSKSCFNQLNRGIWCSSISISTTVQLYRVYIQLILLCGFKTRALTRALEDRITVFDNICLRRILWIRYTGHVTYADVRLRAGSPRSFGVFFSWSPNIGELGLI